MRRRQAKKIGESGMFDVSSYQTHQDYDFKRKWGGQYWHGGHVDKYKNGKIRTYFCFKTRRKILRFKYKLEAEGRPEKGGFRC